ncbi:hypothetical protein FAES_4752 [Fibrella aestuarina BUZ 2]|uniref:Polysaccharide biosynthesis protein n=1 Tax=Fibrella aestuarina BUZ 2 TaxID=1166018 RepID=I0KF48_9BACT|nr:oligosaccharide flippase family protein [Fibrella aestuarina]CCH02751.1 hypothetical protein FAES_4752 [Fibrella aestuarina BUZ 2]
MIAQRIQRELASQKGLVLADQVVVSGSAFLTNLLLARALGAVAYGQFSAVVLCQLFLLSVQQAVGSGIYPIVWANLAPPLRKRYTDGLLYAQLGWLLGLAGLGTLATQLPFFLTGYETGLLVAAGIGTGLYLLQDFLRKLLLTQQRAGRALLLDGLTNAGQLLLLGGSHWLGTLSLLSALWIVGLTFLPSVALGLVGLRPGRFRVASLTLVGQHHRQQGGWMLLSALTQWLAGNFFVLAAGWWLGAAALGALRLAQYIFGLLNVLLQALESYVLPRAAQLAPTPDALITYLRRVLLKSLLGFGPILLLLTIGAEPLLTFAGGADYRAFAYVMYGLTAVYVLVVSSYPIRLLLRVRQLNRHYFVGYALATLGSLSTASWLIGNYGLAGVLAGLFLTQVILLAYWLLVLQHNGLSPWKSFTLFSARPIRPE